MDVGIVRQAGKVLVTDIEVKRVACQAEGAEAGARSGDDRPFHGAAHVSAKGHVRESGDVFDAEEALIDFISDRSSFGAVDNEIAPTGLAEVFFLLERIRPRGAVPGDDEVGAERGSDVRDFEHWLDCDAAAHVVHPVRPAVIIISGRDIECRRTRYV